MEGSSEMMVTAFSHSIAVGKLPVQLPDVPKGVRFDFTRYSPVEAMTALEYYHRYGFLKQALYDFLQQTCFMFDVQHVYRSSLERSCLMFKA
jgi:hypothetical protein